MKVTRTQILLTGLLLAAGAGMYVDQYVLTADAAESADEYSVAAPSAGVKAARPTPAAPEAVLATRLRELAGETPALPDEIRNVFFVNRPSAEADAGVNVKAADAAVAASPITKRTLNGVLFGVDGKGVAIIDKRMIRLGERVDGMRLVQVTKEMAVFSDGKSEVMLYLSHKNSSPN